MLLTDTRPTEPSRVPLVFSRLPAALPPPPIPRLVSRPRSPPPLVLRVVQLIEFAVPRRLRRAIHSGRRGGRPPRPNASAAAARRRRPPPPNSRERRRPFRSIPRAKRRNRPPRTSSRWRRPRPSRNTPLDDVPHLRGGDGRDDRVGSRGSRPRPARAPHASYATAPATRDGTRGVGDEGRARDDDGTVGRARDVVVGEGEPHLVDVFEDVPSSAPSLGEDDDVAGPKGCGVPSGSVTAPRPLRTQNHSVLGRGLGEFQPPGSTPRSRRRRRRQPPLTKGGRNRAGRRRPRSIEDP